ncbi:ORC ubiquitin ligase 1 [Kryptolebias marmoratus]|uniref:RING-type domain-containing protein n=1 Tax=Kryptolebias marmoratus TaxID=37003 RepID=A0A3Q3BH95_KRYMA|nr:ORC ubiquitin ligase 1 [Kryptolebias marmoratus]
MAVNYQKSTLSLTLPISCQICLGKVRQPVICANHHVFCSSCMEMWLKNASQCPTCREPITEENPCREIIGGTNEGDYSETPSMRKSLRKTRGELLLREYEEEIDGLVNENKELKRKTKKLEEELRASLDPCSLSAAQLEDRTVSPFVMEEWKNKLLAATDVCDKIKADMDKLRETNKALRSQNVDLVQENMRLKAEVANRSPQKFGRYTVAVLEAKIQQYEREVDHLKRALERSDQYVDELESRLKKAEKRQQEAPEAFGSSQQQKINMMMRSLSDSERVSICSDPEADGSTFPRNPSSVFLPSADQKNEDPDFLPATPSSAFRSLTLRSPTIREKKVAFKPATFLRRLNFEESPQKAGASVGTKFSSLEKFPKGLNLNDVDSAKSAFWGPWQRSREPSCPGPSAETSTGSISEEPDGFQTASEASMDAAYLDKISELDSMMHDGESSSSRGSQLSLASSPLVDLDGTLVPEPQTGPSGGADMDLASDGKEAPSSSEEDVSSARESVQTEELSFDLLFDPPDEVRAGPSGSPSPVTQPQDQASPPEVPTRERAAASSSQPTKRKSHSPFNPNSPTKLSKLM